VHKKTDFSISLLERRADGRRRRRVQRVVGPEGVRVAVQHPRGSVCAADPRVAQPLALYYITRVSPRVPPLHVPGFTAMEARLLPRYSLTSGTIGALRSLLLPSPAQATSHRSTTHHYTLPLDILHRARSPTELPRQRAGPQQQPPFRRFVMGWNIALPLGRGRFEYCIVAIVGFIDGFNVGFHGGGGGDQFRAAGDVGRVHRPAHCREDERDADRGAAHKLSRALGLNAVHLPRG